MYHLGIKWNSVFLDIFVHLFIQFYLDGEVVRGDGVPFSMML